MENVAPDLKLNSMFGLTSSQHGETHHKPKEQANVLPMLEDGQSV